MVLEALRPVEDPELHRSIVDLDMVRGVDVAGGTVKVTVALTVAGCPLRSEITRRVTEAVAPLEGVGSVDVDLTVMTDEEREALAGTLRHEHAGGDGRPVRVNPFTDSATRVIAIASGKGGVGKSSVTTNLAVALAQRGKNVAAVDADVWGFSMPRMLGIDHPPVVIDDVIIPPEANGVRLISMGFFAREDQPVVWRGPMLHKALEQFLTDVHWDEPEYLIVDMPPGTGDIALSMAQFLPRAEVIVVTTPQPAAQRVAQRAAYMAQKVNLGVIGVIENMSWFRGDDGKAYELFGAGGGQELADQLEVPLLGQVPLVPQLREGADEGRPIVVTHPDDEASLAFTRLAERLDVELAPKRVYRPELKIN
jgi:ATP-binding protein involved in chromosome partitioning